MRHMKNSLIVIAFILMVLYLAGCSEQERILFEAGYQVDDVAGTFLLRQTIQPQSKRSNDYGIIVKGRLDDRRYYLLADSLEIIDLNSGKSKQLFPLAYFNEPYILTLLSQTERIGSELICEDLNFDGYMDFRILADCGTAKHDIYRYWLWDPLQGKFDQNKSLEELELTTPVFNPETQTISSYYADSAADTEEKFYQYFDGDIKLIKWIRQSYDHNLEMLHVFIVEIQSGGLMVKEKYEKVTR